MEKVSNRQLFFLVIFTAIDGLHVTSMACDLAFVSGSGGWVSILMTALIFLIPMAFFLYLGNLFPNKSMTEYSEILVGKVFSKIIIGVFFLYFIINMMFFLRGCGEFIKHEFMIKTPVLAIMIVLVLAGIYAASKTITDIGRLIEFLGIFILIAIFVIHLIMVLSGKSVNVKPFFETDKIGDYAKGIFTCLGAFIGIQILEVIPFQKSEKKSQRNRYMIGGIIFLGILYVFMVESIYGVLGVEQAKNYGDSLVVGIRQINLPFLQILTRLDILFIVSWMFAVFFTTSVNLYAARINLAKLFNLKKILVPLLIISVIVIVGAMIPVDYHDMKMVFEYMNDALSAIVLIVIPVILVIAAKVKKISSKKEPEEGVSEHAA